MNRRPNMTSRGAPAVAPAKGRAADVFIALAMALVVLAIATGLNQHAGLDLNVTVTAGMVVYASMLAVHALLRRQAHRDAQTVRAVEPALVPGRSPQLQGQTPALSQLDVSMTRTPARIGQVPLPPLTPSAAQPARKVDTRAVPPPPPNARSRAFEPAPVAEIQSAQPVAGRGSLEDDVERMQQLVKKLADEISAVDEPSRPPPQIYGRPPRLAAEAVADSSVNVLRHTAQGMRAAMATPPPPPKQRQASPSASATAPVMRPVQNAKQAAADTAPPPLSPAQTHIAAVADALVAGRVDVELEPILSLVDQKTRHYEVSVQVRGPAAEILAGNDNFDGLQGTGLLPLFDCARLQRSVGIAQRLTERNKSGRVFSSYSAESLTSSSFLTDARAALGERSPVASQVVMGFRQADVRAFTASEWAALAELRQMQVTLALDRLTHLDFDLRQLTTAGFAFARVDAESFISGIRFGGKAVPATDLVRYITASGLTLIVDNIDSDTTLQRVSPFGVQLGQGRVFGGRRAVKVSKADAA